MEELIDRKRRDSIDPHFVEMAEKILPFSQFMVYHLKRNPETLLELTGSNWLFSPLNREELYRQAHQEAGDAEDENQLMAAVRLFRNRHMFRIAWRDIAGLASLDETLSDLTNLAEICMNICLQWLYRNLSTRFGSPLYPNGKAQNLIVLAMGKLGARELNFSSDIDLIFAYPQTGVTSGTNSPISNEDFFLRLARSLIKVLSQSTENGLAFRVDTRLRPFGDSGPLVLCSEAVEEYYENYGRQWERYAMVKARAAVGDIDAGNRLLKRLRPFVYKKYLDYSTIEALRQMKAMILAEQDKESLKDDIKLGPGGIRDVEFICQTFQLLKGGRIPLLQERNLLKVLNHIDQLTLLDHETCSTLRQAYIFLRIVENRIQEFSDQQIHNLPSDHKRQLKLAVSTGFSSWDEFRSSLADHMSKVHAIFVGLFAERRQQSLSPSNSVKDSSSSKSQPEPDGSKDLLKQCLLVWEDPIDDASIDILKGLGFSRASPLLKGFKDSKKLQLLPGSTREIVDELMPRLIEACSKTKDPDKGLEGCLRIIEAVLKRSIYLMLLLEYPQALTHLARLCSESRWISDLLSRQPILLDELIDASNLFRPLSRHELINQIDSVTGAIADSDLELLLDELRRIKKANVLKVAACDLDNLIEMDEVGNRLTNLAQVLVETCFKYALDYMCSKEASFYRSNVTVNESGMAVIAYGKMGGREMGYSSDLDLVFLYNPDAPAIRQRDHAGKTTYFFSRLVQRLIFLLTTRTSQGVLYQIDTRLRPNGSQGILVSSIDSFSEYQKKRAWTWEHQALIRARFVAGDQTTGAIFDKIRKDVLMTKRNKGILCKDILQMRKKMVDNIPKGQKGTGFHLKKDRGGIVDIEFIIQYLVLLHAHEYQKLTEATGCKTILHLLGTTGLLASKQVDILKRTYSLYMKTVNHLTLDLKEPKVPVDLFKAERQQISDIFQQVLGNCSKGEIN